MYYTNISLHQIFLHYFQVFFNLDTKNKWEATFVFLIHSGLFLILFSVILKASNEFS